MFIFYIRLQASDKCSYSVWRFSVLKWLWILCKLIELNWLYFVKSSVRLSVVSFSKKKKTNYGTSSSILWEKLVYFKIHWTQTKKNIREQISFSTISGIVTFILLLFTYCFIMLTLFRSTRKISPDKERLWSNCDLKASISSLLINEKLSDIERRRQTVSGEHLVALFQSLGYKSVLPPQYIPKGSNCTTCSRAKGWIGCYQCRKNTLFLLQLCLKLSPGQTFL